ncbi:hypothetical protein [Gordonia alkaliphila]|uniref:hypothetical protein n=1 Tax=Gordonia alkaliphila TaxID=1053547 RepID=UPI0031EA3BBD
MTEPITVITAHYPSPSHISSEEFTYQLDPADAIDTLIQARFPGGFYEQGGATWGWITLDSRNVADIEIQQVTR